MKKESIIKECNVCKRAVKNNNYYSLIHIQNGEESKVYLCNKCGSQIGKSEIKNESVNKYTKAIETRKSNKEKIDSIGKETILDMYYNKGMTAKYIAIKVGVKTEVINTLIKNDKNSKNKSESNSDKESHT